MTSCKLCLMSVVLIAVSVAGSALYDSSYDRRVRRSDPAKQHSSEQSSTEDDDDHGYRTGYRFGEEFFLPEASKSIPSEYKKQADGCERVTKKSMVCMVCRDPKTNAKYEQCSYVGNPTSDPIAPRKQSDDNYESSNPSALSFESSESSPSPGSASHADYHELSTPSRDYESAYESSEPSSGRPSNSKATEGSRRGYKMDAQAPYSYFENLNDESESSEIPAESSNCRDIEKGSKTCRICKDPRTGKDVERCSSSYKPDDETYAYGKTEKYGYPESLEYDADEKSDDKSYETNAESSEEPATTTDCHRIRENGQTCTVCKDRKTGRDSKRCSSSYRPADKTYEYGNSETYGGPTPYASKDHESKSYNIDEDDKTADATYDNPTEYRSAYSKPNDDNYDRRSSYDHESTEASSEAPSSPVASTKPQENGGTKGCHKVEKDSTTCTVCTDPKTGGNFEKCSYAYKPNDEVYKFTKSKTFGYPKTQEDIKKSWKNKKSDTADFPRQSESQQIVKAVKENVCKQVEKESMICTICKDAKTGASSEQCAYGSKPSGKMFSYTTSKSFGKPRGKGEKSGEASDQEEQQENRQVALRHGKQDGQLVAESKQVDDAISESSCRKIEKNSMICTVCEDRKTGTSSEQCSYSSKPKKNGYTYSKSESSGNPKKARKEFAKKNDEEPEKTRLNVETAEETSPCRKIEKDSMTCTICKDPKTGGNSEQCVYSYKPKERHFTYSNSKSFGNPRRTKEERDEEESSGGSSRDGRGVSR